MIRPQKIAPGVFRIVVGTTNVYFLGEPDESWALVDAGLPGSEARIIAAADRLYGTSPTAIMLTHGHADHAGASASLADHWRVPVYAHRLERPFLTGRAKYPPMDPTLGGAAGFASRFVPMPQSDLGARLRDLSGSGETPVSSKWRWIDAHGHSPGQVAYFRESDSVLIAGDALTTLNLNTIAGNLMKVRGLYGPAEASTCDWDSAEVTVQNLALLEPTVLACGHGLPYLAKDGTAKKLKEFADVFTAPSHGRYVSDPAEFDESGITFMPPPVADPLRPVVAGAAFLSIGLLAWLFARMSPPRSPK